HFEICGGCALQHLDNALQLQLKQQQLAESLERLARLAPARWLAPLKSRPWSYRRRARLGVKNLARQGRGLVGFFERGRHPVSPLERCAGVWGANDSIIAPLSELIQQLSIRERLPQIEVAVGDDTAALVLRVLESPSEQDGSRLREFEAQHGIRIFLQSGGLDTVRALSEPAPRLSYALPEADLELEFGPTDFIQVNAEANRALVAAAGELLELTPESRVLDLYCGLGNFSLALARRAHSVVGVEGPRPTACRNGIANAQFFRTDLSGLDLSGAPWLRPGYTHIVLDPPRVGAREMLPRIAQLAPQRVLYVSCHPGTLARG